MVAKPQKEKKAAKKTPKVVSPSGKLPPVKKTAAKTVTAAAGGKKSRPSAPVKSQPVTKSTPVKPSAKSVAAKTTPLKATKQATKKTDAAQSASKGTPSKGIAPKKAATVKASSAGDLSPKTVTAKTVPAKVRPSKPSATKAVVPKTASVQKMPKISERTVPTAKTPTTDKSASVPTTPVHTVPKAAEPGKPAPVAVPPVSPATSERKLLIDKLKSVLLAKRDMLRRSLNDDRNDDSRTTETTGDIADIASGYTETELLFQLAEAGSKELSEIDRAVRRIENGTYGVCERCGRDIPIARLKALPFAAKCVACQEAEDQARARGFYFDDED